MEIPVELIPVCGVILLGIISIFIRYLGGFQLENVGSDFGLSATSLQLAQIFTRLINANVVPSDLLALPSDMLFFLVFIVFWVLALIFVKKALKTEKRIFKGTINPFTALALLIGTIAMMLEIFVRSSP